MTAAMLALTEAGTCTRCGVSAKYRNSAGECNACHNLGYQERRQARKAQLAAMDRCELCNRRGTQFFQQAEGVLLCGRHGRRLQAGMAGMGVFAGIMTITRAQALRVAR